MQINWTSYVICSENRRPVKGSHWILLLAWKYVLLLPFIIYIDYYLFNMTSALEIYIESWWQSLAHCSYFQLNSMPSRNSWFGCKTLVDWGGWEVKISFWKLIKWHGGQICQYGCSGQLRSNSILYSTHGDSGSHVCRYFERLMAQRL